MLFGCSAGRVRVQGWGKGIFSLFMRTELSEIYDFCLGFWKWRPGGRIAFYVLIEERSFGAEGSNDYFFSWGVSLQPLAFWNWKMEMFVFNLPNLVSQTEKEQTLPTTWRCPKTGWEGFRCGSTLCLWEKSLVYVRCSAPNCYEVCVRGQESECVCPSVHVCCPFLVWYIPCSAHPAYQRMPFPSCFLWGMNLKVAWTHPIHCL